VAGVNRDGRVWRAMDGRVIGIIVGMDPITMNG
jgi:hypothetical protein